MSRRPTILGRRRSTRPARNDEDDVNKQTQEEALAESDSDEEERTFEFDGVMYQTYQEMVNAKRKRNEEYLKKNGLWNPMEKVQKTPTTTNGIKKRKTPTANSAPRRKSSRLAGTPSDGKFVEHEGKGSFVISGQSHTTAISKAMVRDRARINDGEALSLEEAVNLCDPKWHKDTSVPAAHQFLKDLPREEENRKLKKSSSPSSVVVSTIESQIRQLSVDDDSLVAKVTPERIYSVAAHPSKNTLIVTAGDKNGYVGIWNVGNAASSATDGVHLFRCHTRPVNALQWTSSKGLLSASYDGTVRYLDVEHESFEQLFGCEDDQDKSYYTQYLTLDPRNNNGLSFFVSTSMGTVMHVDRRLGGSKGRSKSKATFQAQLSDKKINSVSVHRDGYCLASAGLDRTVKFWDLRKFGGTTTSSKPVQPKGAFLGEHFNKLSVNSAFFSPSGEYMVATNMANTLNVYQKAHLQLDPGKNVVQPVHVISHNNNTGRWLTTFMAQWHPELDIFCVGSMQKPRAVDVFDGASGDQLRAIQGEALTAVASRCCFHPSADKLVLVGGNSSGRVTVCR